MTRAVRARNASSASTKTLVQKQKALNEGATRAAGLFRGTVENRVDI